MNPIFVFATSGWSIHSKVVRFGKHAHNKQRKATPTQTLPFHTSSLCSLHACQFSIYIVYFFNFCRPNKLARLISLKDFRKVIDFSSTPFFQISRCGSYKSALFNFSTDSSILNAVTSNTCLLKSAEITVIIFNLKQSNYISQFTNGKEKHITALTESNCAMHKELNCIH